MIDYSSLRSISPPFSSTWTDPQMMKYIIHMCLFNSKFKIWNDHQSNINFFQSFSHHMTKQTVSSADLPYHLKWRNIKVIPIKSICYRTLSISLSSVVFIIWRETNDHFICIGIKYWLTKSKINILSFLLWFPNWNPKQNNAALHFSTYTLLLIILTRAYDSVYQELGDSSRKVSGRTRWKHRSAIFDEILDVEGLRSKGRRIAFDTGGFLNRELKDICRRPLQSPVMTW